MQISLKVCYLWMYAFERGLILETAGPDDCVAKLMPPLTIEESTLQEGLDILEHAVRSLELPKDLKR